MTELHNFDLSRHTPLDKANFYFEMAIDCANKDDQFYYLVPALSYAQKAGLSPIDFLVDKIIKLPITYITDASNNATGTRDIESDTKCQGSCDSGCAARCQSKISVSLAEILENFRDNPDNKSFPDNW